MNIDLLMKEGDYYKLDGEGPLDFNKVILGKIMGQRKDKKLGIILTIEFDDNVKLSKKKGRPKKTRQQSDLVLEEAEAQQEENEAEELVRKAIKKDKKKTGQKQGKRVSQPTEDEEFTTKPVRERTQARKEKIQTRNINLFKDDMSIGLGQLLSPKQKKKIKPRTVPPRPYRTDHEFKKIRCFFCHKMVSVSVYELNLYCSKQGREYDEDSEEDMRYRCCDCLGGRR